MLNRWLSTADRGLRLLHLLAIYNYLIRDIGVSRVIEKVTYTSNLLLRSIGIVLAHHIVLH